MLEYRCKKDLGQHAGIELGPHRYDATLQTSTLCTGEVLNGATSVKTDGARLDIAVSGFWGGRFEKTYLDVRIFNPHAPSNRGSSTTSCYRKHENEKKRAYEQRLLEIEHSTFTPLVFSATGGMARQSTTFYKDWPHCLPKSGIIRIAQHSVGFAIALPSLCYVRQFNASVAPVPPLAMPLSQPLPSTW